MTYVASCVRVKVEDDGTVRVPEVHTAIDCGFAANPERIRSQIEGAAVMGMTLALNSAITFENGAVQQSNYSDYDVVRCNNFPELVVTHIVPHPFSVHATGVGEPGVPPFAPALYNAIFNATGKRLRTLPIGRSAEGVTDVATLNLKGSARSPSFCPPAGIPCHRHSHVSQVMPGRFRVPSCRGRAATIWLMHAAERSRVGPGRRAARAISLPRPCDLASAT